MTKTHLKQRIIGAIVLVGMAVIFLPMLMQETRGPVVNLNKIPTVPIQSNAQTIKPIPPVALQNATQQTPATTAWTLQLGAFAQSVNASKLLAKLQRAGYPAYAINQKTAEGNIMRVYVGPEVNRVKLQREAKKLADNLNLKGTIVRYQTITNNIQDGKS